MSLVLAGSLSGVGAPLQKVALSSLPSAVGLRTGAAFEISDYKGNIAISVNGVWWFEYPFRTKWAGRPAANLVPAGTELQVTDYNNQKFISDGTDWSPAQGSVVLLRKWGSSAVPIASVTGGSDYQFALSVTKVPAGMIRPGALLRLEADIIRYGTASSGYIYYKLGTANGYTDGSISSRNTAASNSSMYRESPTLAVSESGLVGTTTGTIQPNSSGSAWGTIGPSQWDIASDMYLSAHIRAANSADRFDLIGYSLILEA